MKILYHHRTRREGVEGVHIKGIINAFRSLGHEVIECALVSGDDASKGKATKHFSRLRTYYNYISLYAPEHFFKVLEILYNIISYFRLKKIIKNGDIDLIFDRYALFGFSPIWVAKQYRIPIICEVNIISSLEDVRKARFKWLAQKIEKIILSNVQLLVVVSTNLKKNIRASGCRTPIVVLPNAVNPNLFVLKENYNLKLKYRKSESIVLIGFLGRLVSWYKLHEAVVSTRRLIDQGYPVHLLIIGEGKCRSELEKLITELEIKDHIHLTGYIDHNLIPYYIKQIDIAILPNTNEWGSPMKLFEYMVMGKPIVAPAYGPVKEVIAEGETGLLFKKNDFDEMKNKIKILLDDPDLRKSIGENGKEYVEKNHTWLVNAQKILQQHFHIKNTNVKI